MTRPFFRRSAILCFVCLALSGCRPTLLLRDSELRTFPATVPSTRILFCRVDVVLGVDGVLTERQHLLIRAGKQPGKPDMLFVAFDGSVERLTHYEARVRRVDGKEERFDRGDLYSVAMSGAAQISESHLRLPQNIPSLRPDDLVEVVTEHAQSFTELGSAFDLSSLPFTADVVQLTITSPVSVPVRVVVQNDSLTPVVTTIDGGRNVLRSFRWTDVRQEENRSPFVKKNAAPAVYASFGESVAEQGTEWRSFGRWYLAESAPKLTLTDSLRKLSAQITSGLRTDAEKMEAIYAYCSKNIRYEQVYMANGEFIPNPVPLIVQRGYGDCKDYASVIVTLARAAGIPADLALCYRGRGREFVPGIPVSQFNHMIAHWSDNGTDRWYDGTNRSGTPGITTMDLLNAPAVVLNDDSTRVVTIRESRENRLEITGSLRVDGVSLRGDLHLRFSSQYAADPAAMVLLLDERNRKEYFARWLHTHLHSDLVITDMNWEQERGRFTLHITGTLPNAVTRINGTLYTSIAKVFPAMMPDQPLPEKEDELFLFPKYGHTTLDVTLANALSAADRSPASLRWTSDLPAGPFLTPEERASFRVRFAEHDSLFHAPRTLIME